MKTFCKSVTRHGVSLTSIKIWNEGESKELQKWLGVGLFNSFFVSENQTVSHYYDTIEAENYWQILKQKLTESFFDQLCDFYFNQIEKSKNISDENEICQTYVRIFPILTIFDDISKYPQDLANENILRRLIRLRESSQDFSYILSSKLKHENLKNNFIFFRQKIYSTNFNDFIKQNNIKIENEL